MVVLLRVRAPSTHLDGEHVHHANVINVLVDHKLFLQLHDKPQASRQTGRVSVCVCERRGRRRRRRGRGSHTGTDTPNTVEHQTNERKINTRTRTK